MYVFNFYPTHNHRHKSIDFKSDVDDLGFMRPWSPIEESGCQKQYETWYAAYLPIVVRRRCRWEKENPRRNSHLLQRFVRKGIPHTFRKELWLRSCPSRKDGVWERHEVPDEVIKQIKLDLPRTFPDNKFLKTEKTRKTLGRALFAVAEHIPSVGYCQGLNFVAGIILLVVNDEARAIDLLVHLVSQRQDYYGKNMIGLRRDMHVLHSLLREHCPRVVVTLEKLDVGLDMLVGKWFVCWFVESLPMETVLRLWDCMIYEGDEWLFKVAVTLFRSNMIAISSCETIDQLMTEIQNIGTSKAALYCHQLILKSAALPITNKSIEYLRVDAEKAIPE
ncbi:hypothetical protein CRE_26486 [Caenorhabditis remanei]|uniref:Rab-GAP TBC domain-containing protein n=1 Tax=Caenorhabditis remanei TaxID=31234 RepID=E3LQT6_CAERE|nr:hypothetical protein CRE_26486 [Caenorhabditis remanei]